MSEMDHMEETSPNTHGYSNPPPVAPRRDTKALALRRYHSSNPNYNERTRFVSVKAYESEYDKLTSYMRKSMAMKQKARERNNEENVNQQERRQRAYTHIPPHATRNDIDEDLYLSTKDIATAPLQSNHVRVSRSPSPIPLSNGPNCMPESTPPNQVHYVAKPKQRTEFQVETAIYGVAQGKGTNIVMQLKELQQSANNFYRSVITTNATSPEIADLKTHLRIGDKAPISEVLRHIHQTLLPPELTEEKQKEYTEIYLVDFSNCTDKITLRDKLLNLFTTPGPPSVAYQRVNAKLDALINNFAEMVVKMRLIKNETIVSPYHAQSILQGQEADQLIRVLQSNELWIRWGTESGLPPMQDIYMFKYPPTYEMRKAITLSQIAQRKDIIKMLFTSQTRLETLVPPIYSKLESSDDNKWQVSEFNPDTKKFETRECVLPAWIEECGKLVAHLKSGNRSSFRRGDHIYALYSVYIIVLKDITLTENFGKESKIPCSHQIYVGSSSTGVLYRFMNVANNHCDRMKNVMEKAPMLESFRCFQETELVDACLILSWIRRQPQAVFVINSFQEGPMTNLSLNKKKPFFDKMSNLQQHYINSKKLGPLHDMRFGMNCMGDTTYSHVLHAS